MKNLKMILFITLSVLSFYSFGSTPILGNSNFNAFDSNPIIKIKTTSDYFVGKWKVMVEGTPNGDVIMNVTIKKEENKYVGSVQSEGSGSEPVKADKIEITDNELKIYWLAGGYNVYLQLEKVNENAIEGSLMDMFDAKGERIIE